MLFERGRARQELSLPVMPHACHGKPRFMRHAAFGAPPGHATTACLLLGFTRVLHYIEKRTETVNTVKTVVNTDCKTRDNRENRGMSFKESITLLFL